MARVRDLSGNTPYDTVITGAGGKVERVVCTATGTCIYVPKGLDKSNSANRVTLNGVAANAELDLSIDQIVGGTGTFKRL